MRKGFTLIELLTVAAMMVTVMALFSGIFETLVTDVPRMQRAVEVNSRVSEMLVQMRKDVESAQALLDYATPDVPPGESLLVHCADGSRIWYHLEEGTLFRRILADGNSRNSMSWQLPRAQVNWTLWKKNPDASEGYAVEVRTGMRVNIGYHEQKKLAGTHVLFVGAFPAPSKDGGKQP